MQSRLQRGMAPTAAAARTLRSTSSADGAGTGCDGLKEGEKRSKRPSGSPWGFPGRGADPHPEAGRVPSRCQKAREAHSPA